MFITICICISICLVLSVVACALYMFHRGRVGNVLSIPLYFLTCKVIDNKATLILTLTTVCFMCTADITLASGRSVVHTLQVNTDLNISQLDETLMEGECSNYTIPEVPTVLPHESCGTLSLPKISHIHHRLQPTISPQLGGHRYRATLSMTSPLPGHAL